MKHSFLFIIVLILLMNCQQSHYGRSSEIAELQTESLNSALLVLQFQIVEIKREEGRWVESKSDYARALGDSANVMLVGFDVLSFTQSSDTLIVNYKLKESNRLTRPSIEFLAPKVNEGSSMYKFDSSVQQTKNEEFLKMNEGRLTFSQNDSHAITIIHEYYGGIAKNKITHAQE